MSVATLFYVWCILAAGTAALALYRKTLAHREAGFQPASIGQARMASEVHHRLEVVERWGKTLTAIVVIYGLILLGAVFFQAWLADGGRVNFGVRK
jgi:hypothetical protein